MGDLTESMDWVVRRLIEEHLLAHPGALARDTWPTVAERATMRLRESVTESVVAGIFWIMHDEGLVDSSMKGTLWLSNPKT